MQARATCSQVEKLQTQLRSLKRSGTKAEMDEDGEAKINEAKGIHRGFNMFQRVSTCFNQVERVLNGLDVRRWLLGP